MEDYTPYVFSCPAYEGRSLNTIADDMALRGLISRNAYKSSTYSWDDVGLGELMVDIHDDAYRYCVNTKTWLVWQDNRWLPVPHENYMINAVAQFTSLLLIYAREMAFLHPEDTDILKAYEEFIHRMRTHKKITDVVRYLSTDVDVKVSQLDWNPYILKTSSVAIDLTTGQPYEDEKSLLATLQAGTHTLRPYDVPNTRWQSFIDEIMSHDKEKAKFLQRALGYSLLGTNAEECMFIAYGPKSRNGKGTLFSAIGAALGTYMRSCSAKFICTKPNEREVSFDTPQPFLADLAGVRLVSMSEADENEMLSSASLKSLTGRDLVTTRQLYGKPYSYQPQFTLWLSTNYLPNVSDSTIFLSNRVWVIRFDETFRDNPETDLKDIFMSEEARPTVLSWLVDGCLDYYKQGLNPPQCIVDVTEQYKKQSDPIGRFLDEMTERKPYTSIRRADLYDLYRMWCSLRDNQLKPQGIFRFSKQLENRGLMFDNLNGVSMVVGITTKQKS